MRLILGKRASTGIRLGGEIIHTDTCLADSIYNEKIPESMVGEMFHCKVISSDSKTDTCTFRGKNRMIDYEVGTSWTEYLEVSR